MVRTRRSLAADTGAKAEAVAPAVGGGNTAAPAKRPRGRHSNAALAATTTSHDSPSSAAQSNCSSNESVSGYSTPLTSHVATPAPDKSQPAAASSVRSNKLEVVIPARRATRTSVAKALQDAKDFITANDSKRKRAAFEVADSEDDDLSDGSPMDSRTRHDEEVARQLQEQFYREAEDLESEHNAEEAKDRDDDDDDDMQRPSVSEPKGKGKGKAAAPSRSRRSRSAAKAAIPDSDEEEDSPEAFDEEPPSKRQKKASGLGRKASAKGKGKVPAAQSESEDDMPLATTRGRKSKNVEEESEAEASESEFTDSGHALAPGEMAGDDSSHESDEDDDQPTTSRTTRMRGVSRRGYRQYQNNRGVRTVRHKLEKYHPVLKTMWKDLEATPVLKTGKIEQPQTISRLLKPFQLEGVAWMKAMEQAEWKGGLLGDEMGLGKTIQAVSLVMSDYPAGQPTLVLVPPVALMQWVSEIESYTDGTLKTLVFHGTNPSAKAKTLRDLKQYDVIIMSYNSLESMYRKQEKGHKKKEGIYKEKSLIHALMFHRVILDEAHCIKTRTTMTAKACFALNAHYRWCLSGTPLQNRIGEFFSLIRFLNVEPFASYFCKQCPCASLEWTMDDNHRCTECKHNGMQHISVFNQELLNPIQRYGNSGEGKAAFEKLRLMTDRIMLRRLKKDNTNSMELPVKEIYVDRQFFSEVENDFAQSIMGGAQRNFDTYVAQGVMLNNYANIFGLIMQMRQVADHPDLILKKNAEGGQNILVCCICDEPAEEAIRSRCKHDFCRTCAQAYLNSQEQPDCPRCHIPLSIDLEQPEMEQDESLVKKNSIINRIKMENWTSSSKIELLVHELHKLRSDKASHKSIIFSQFTTMLQLIEWRLRRAGITTVMLDGSMTPAQRAASIDYFMKNVEVECFLVSLKAGGVALNLTEASRVFIVDPWWNPAAEWQSADRCHRIGQTRPCTITRLCIEDSVESRMVLLQEKKTNMINSTINSDDAAMESLTPEDLQFLFRGS